ncbi:hypothetical protein [Fibrella aquatilis]|uniref:Uncharacterized protein n=1 Tax=Fibrella aquatilis TaxID=2817059 RepID=A0A939G8P2_9BACT|nr:hypothetical protein [Fibrella aquatilis]MBO0933901.1 hypothetical protein [Fibrella aquatilis]
MKAKLYLITQQDNILGVVKHISYEKAFNAFRKRGKVSGVIHAQILTPDELYETILDGLKLGEMVKAT